MNQPPAALRVLCLSGGGFRALHWHLGSLRALNEGGWLARLDCISGVSAGALAAAWLGLQWPRLEFDAAGGARNLEGLVLAPLRRLLQQRIGITPSLLSWLPLPGLPARLLASELDRLLLRGARLADLTPAPRTLLNATDLATAEPVVFDRAGLGHGAYGTLALPRLPLAQAAAASCACPPFFAPALIGLRGAARDPRWTGPARLALADGVVIDNLGLAALPEGCGLLLVSDASLPRKHPSPLAPSWHSVLLHVQRAQFHQARLARLALLRAQFASGACCGAYWGLEGAPLAQAVSGQATGGTFELGRAVLEPAAYEALQRIPANLLRLPAPRQQALEDAAYRVARAALAGCAIEGAAGSGVRR